MVRLDRARAQLDRPSDNVALLVVAVVALPLATGIVLALAAGFHDQRPVLIGTTAVGLALAVGGTLADLPTAAGLGKILAAGALGMLFIPLLDRAWHVAVVALLVIGVDTYSVFAGPTKQLLEQGDDVISTFTVPLTAPGMYGAAGIGITDFLFLGLFCGAALHWRLRPRLTLPLCALSFSASVAVAQRSTAPCPPAAAVAGVRAAQHRTAAGRAHRTGRGSCGRIPPRPRTRGATPPRDPTGATSG